MQRGATLGVQRNTKGDVVKKLFADAGVEYPPRQLLLRVFKNENILEVWAASSRHESLSHVATYEICSQSGDLGPKRREGDGQVPEGFYHLDYYNSQSSYYLSMRVNYPNGSDRILSDQKSPGSDIMIHGNCVSIGCLAMSDERIQELWVMTHSLRKGSGEVYVHIFPSSDFAALLADEGLLQHHAFWRNLKEGHDYFEQDRRLPKVSVESTGLYLFQW